MSCEMDGKPGYKYGESGKCHTYTRGDEASMKAAKDKAIKQGQAMSGGGKLEEWHSFVEFTSNRGVTMKVDRENNVVHGVKVLGLNSKNGRNYSKRAVEAAAGMYEGANVNIDHPRQPNEPRSYASRFGKLRNVSVREDGLYGDLVYNPKHAVAEQFAWDAEHSPESVGMSHNVMGTSKKSGGKETVEAITNVISVDVVADPATTQSLFESIKTNEEDDEMSLDQLTVESLRESRPDLIESIVADLKKGDETQALQAKVKTLTEQLDKLNAEKAAAARRASVEAKITEAKLPEYLVTDVFREQLLSAADDAQIARLIEDRKAIHEAAPKPVGGKPVSREQNQPTGIAWDKLDSKGFAEAISIH